MLDFSSEGSARTKAGGIANMRKASIAVMLAIATSVAAMLLQRPQALDLLALILAYAAAVYIGFALLDGRRRESVLELAARIFFGAFALLGLWFSPLFLVVGFVTHGLWDIFHHPGPIKTKIVRWYPPVCLVYDWLIAGFMLWWWRAIT